MKKVVLICVIIILLSLVIAICLSINNGGYVENNVDWIGYVGSVTGGVLTLASVWWTIHDNEMKRLEDNKPIIVPSALVIENIKSDEGGIAKLLIEIKNTGKSIATDFAYSDSLSKRNNTDGDGLTSPYLLPGACFNLVISVPYDSFSELEFDFEVNYGDKGLKTKYYLKYRGECARTVNDELICYLALIEYKESKI